MPCGEDKAGQKVLSDVFRAAEASVELSAILVNIRMALEERTEMTGEVRYLITYYLYPIIRKFFFFAIAHHKKE